MKGIKRQYAVSGSPEICHLLTVLVVKKGIEDKCYIQSITSNSPLCHLPGLEDLSRKKLQGIASGYVGLIVSLLEKTVGFDVIDLRDSQNGHRIRSHLRVCAERSGEVGGE